MNEDFSFNGKDRDLFIEALRNYSDSCAAPELTPGCPFFEPTPRGPICGEQCQDLLAAHGHIYDPKPILRLGPGLGAYKRRPRRPRRGPEPTTRPYDAQRLYLGDHNRPTDLRHTASLLLELDKQLTTPPWLAEDSEERSYLIDATFRELTGRGFPPNDLLAGLSGRIAGSMLSLLIAHVALDDEANTPDDSLRIDDRWQAAQQLLEPDDTAGSGASFALAMAKARKVYNAVSKWAASLSLEELAEWPPFGPDLPANPSIPERGSRERGRWMLDRFTHTYLDNWHPASIRLEWMYLHGKSIGCAPPGQMKLRQLDAAEVATEFTRRAVEQGEPDGPGATGTFSASDFTPIAVDYLKLGRYEAAVALFEALFALSPEDAVLANNLAFCLLPTNPDRALSLLNDSSRMAHKPSAVNFANRVLALYLLNRSEEALVVGRESLDYDSESFAWLWLPDENGSLTLGENINTREYIDSLIARIDTKLD